MNEEVKNLLEDAAWVARNTGDRFLANKIEALLAGRPRIHAETSAGFTQAQMTPIIIEGLRERPMLRSELEDYIQTRCVLTDIDQQRCSANTARWRQAFSNAISVLRKRNIIMMTGINPERSSKYGKFEMVI